MDCPGCGCEFTRRHDHCPECGFSLASLSHKLGSGLVRLERLTDAAHCLRLRESRLIETQLDEFQGRFPQVCLTVFLGVLPGSLNLRELSFWLLNRAAFGGPDQRRLNEHAILLAVDPAAKTAAITVGYALERMLTERRLGGILRSMRTALWHGEYAPAIGRGISLLDRRLRRSGRGVQRVEEMSPPESCEEFLDDAGLRSLRGHPAPSEERTAWQEEESL